MVLERLRWPTSAEIQRALTRAFAEHGTPARVLTDNGSVFKALRFELFLAEHDVEHTFTKPAHPWTNGRIERLFRTFKQSIDRGRWLISSSAQVDRFCRDFLTFYNRDRPHSAWGGRTPDEVYFDRRPAARPLGRVTYFDGALHWYRFGGLPAPERKSVRRPLFDILVLHQRAIVTHRRALMNAEHAKNAPLGRPSRRVCLAWSLQVRCLGGRRSLPSMALSHDRLSPGHYSFS